MVSPGGFTGLPGAVAVSHLSVYDWPAAAGLLSWWPVDLQFFLAILDTTGAS